MEQFQPLSNFFTAIAEDPRIGITHIGLYAAVLQYWQQHGFASPVQVFSYELMQTAKISAGGTFYKTMRELHEYGYLKYQPSFNHNKGSRIYILREGPH